MKAFTLCDVRLNVGLLEADSRDGLPVKQGTLYPVLRSLEPQGRLAGTGELSASGPNRY